MSNLVRLGDVVRVRHGGTPSKSNPAFWQGDIPWVSPKDFVGGSFRTIQDFVSAEAVSNSATSIVPAGTVLTVARSGVLAHSFPAVLADRPVSFNQDIKALLPDESRIDPRFLHHFLRSAEKVVVQQGVKRGATVHSLQAGFLEGLTLRLPSLDEQRRIVDILDRAASIRRLRQQAENTVHFIIPALFNKMFGDPATNPMGWPTELLGDVVKGFEGGRSLQADSETADDGSLQILKISAVTSGVFRPDEAKPAPRGYVPPSHHFLRDGDLLFSRANTAELVGATAMVRNPPANLLLPDKLWRVQLRNPSRVTVEFLLAWFKQASTRAAVSCLATGTSASMRNISQGRLSTIKIILPPMELQRKFAETATSLEGLSLRQASGQRIAEFTISSLQSSMFG